MWSGYLTIGGMEISNACRTETYAQPNSWFKPLYGCSNLIQVLGDDPYRTPMLDDAPWVDPVEPESVDFYGFYLLDVTGAEDSSRVVTFTDSTGDGARPSRVRHGAKTLVFDGLLIGCSEAAVEYGMRWLRNALLASPCGPGTATYTCGGSNLCYFASPPCSEVDSPECWEQAFMDVGRTLRKFAVTNGPTVTSKQIATDGAHIWRVTFTGMAGVPWEYGFEQCIVDGFLNPNVPDPYACGDVNGTPTSVGENINDADNPCPINVWSPVYDPLCPPLDPPPAPPSIALGCVDAPTEWTRYNFTIPSGVVPLWTDMVPILTVTAQQVVRNVRVRFYADPFGTGNPDDDPCAFCGDFLITYMPANSVMTLDGATETVTVVSQNDPPRNAGTLVFATDGGPFEWPLLSCGVPYIVTIDVPRDADFSPYIDMSLIPRTA